MLAAAVSHDQAWLSTYRPKDEDRDQTSQSDGPELDILDLHLRLGGVVELGIMLEMCDQLLPATPSVFYATPSEVVDEVCHHRRGAVEFRVLFVRKEVECKEMSKRVCGRRSSEEERRCL